MLRALKVLARDPSIHIYVISGRDQVSLDKWLGFIDQLGLRLVLREGRVSDLCSAEHGCFLRYPSTTEWINLSEELDFSWKNDVLPIFEV